MHSETQGAMMKPDEALALVGRAQISRRVFYNAINRNEIPHRPGRRILIPRHAFMLWLEGKTQVGGSAAA